MKFELKNVDFQIDKKVNMIVESEDDSTLTIDLSNELDGDEYVEEIGIVEFNENNELVFVEKLSDMIVGKKYYWCYVDDVISELEDMEKEDWENGGTIVRVE